MKLKINKEVLKEKIVKDCVKFYRLLRIETWRKNYPLTKEFQEDLEKTIRKAIDLYHTEVKRKIDEKIKIIRPSLSLKLTLEEQNERFFAINKLEELKKQVG